MKVEKELKVEDRHRQGLEIDPVKVLKSLGWKEEDYHIDNENKTVYAKNLEALIVLLGLTYFPHAQSKQWKGWTWKRGGKRED